VRREAGCRQPDLEGQGEVIEVSVQPSALTALDGSDELLQSGFWGRFKQEQGWRPAAFLVTVEKDGSSANITLLVLTRRLARFFTIAYVPFGPCWDPQSGRGDFLSLIARRLRRALPRGTLFLRFDLPWLKEGEEPSSRRRPRISKAASDMQPASTVIVDIAPPLEEILKSMKNKTRYNIGLAERKGVVVRIGTDEDLDQWYALYEETSRRDRIGIHSLSYYRGLFRTARENPGSSPALRLLIAEHQGDLLAGNIVAFWKERAIYLYGASSGLKRNLMPTYALQWEAIRLAKEAGCLGYDLYGVPPRPDPGHPMFGLYQFKTGFSENVIERWGTWDAPYHPILCAGYDGAEGLRMFYFRVLRKRRRAQTRGNDS